MMRLKKSLMEVAATRAKTSMMSSSSGSEKMDVVNEFVLRFLILLVSLRDDILLPFIFFFQQLRITFPKTFDLVPCFNFTD